MRRRGALTLLGTLLLAALPAGAGAAAPWSTPIKIGPSTPCAPGIAYGGTGAGIVSWTPSCVSGPKRTRLASAGGALLQTLPRLPAAPIVAYGANRTALVRQRLLTRATDFRHDSRTRIDVAFGRTDGSVGVARTIVTIRNLEHLEVAASPRGDLAVGWVEFRCVRSSQGECERTKRLLRVAVRVAGHRFSKPVTISADRRFDDSELAATDPALAFDARGDLVVAYSGRRATAPRTLLVLAKVRRAGHRFGRTLVVGPRRAVTDIAAAYGGDGTIQAVWGTQDGGEEANEPFVVRAARRAPGAARFGRSRVLDHGGAHARPLGHVQVAISAGGVATAAWTQVLGKPVSGYPVRVATTGANGRFGAAAEVAPLGAVDDLVQARDGTALLVWGRVTTADPDQAVQVMAAVRGAGDAAFGAAEAVSDADRPSVADAAFDPATGNAVVVWTARQAVAPQTAAGIRLATRAAAAPAPLATQASVTHGLHHHCTR
jgi:hypothetical protein